MARVKNVRSSQNSTETELVEANWSDQPVRLRLSFDVKGTRSQYELNLPSLRQLAKQKHSSEDYTLSMPKKPVYQRKRDKKLKGKLESRIVGPELLLRPVILADVEDTTSLTEAEVKRMATVTGGESREASKI